MKKSYITPELNTYEVSVLTPIAASDGQHYEAGDLGYGGGTGAGGVIGGDANRRGYRSTRDEMVGGWRRGGLW